MSFFRWPTKEVVYKNYRHSPQPTRIDRCEELHPVVTIVEKIRHKVEELDKARQRYGAADASYNKFPIMQDCLKKIDLKIDEFNNGEPEDEDSKEFAHAKQLVSQLEAIVAELLDDKKVIIDTDGQEKVVDGPRLAVINEKRDDNKSIACTTAEVYLPLATGVVVANFTFLAGLAYFGLAAAGGNSIKKAYDLGNENTASNINLTALRAALKEANQKLNADSPAPVLH